MEQKIICGDNIEVLKTLADNSIDACVTDPPYGISFMWQKWDYDVPSVELWREVLRVLKPGGYLLSFGGTRTYHRLVVNIEDAGFEIRDQLQWIFGQGFPKSHSIEKAIDKAAGAERKVVGKYVPPNGKEWNLKQSENSDVEHAAGTFTASGTRTLDITDAATDEAKSAVGLGTALKPSHEPIVLARKPLEKGLTVAENFLKYGTGGMNIDGCRISTDETITNHSRSAESAVSKGKYGDSEEQETHQTEGQRLGRFPSNVILSHHSECVYVGIKQVKGSNCKPSDIGKGRDGKNFTNGIYGEQESKVTISHTDEDGNETVEAWECVADCPIRILDEQSGILKSGAMKKPYVYKNTGFSLGAPAGATKQIHESSEGGASRFFYCAKASKSEREKGLENFEAKSVAQRANNHPTVKPVSLLRYLVRLITPPNGICLDPFAGSCTTGVGCKLEGFNCILIERESEYCEIGKARISGWEAEKETYNQLNLWDSIC